MIGLEHGLLMGLFGIMITIAGFMAAYIIAFKHKENEEKKKAEAAAGLNNGVPYTIIKVETPIKLVPDKPRIDPVSGKEIDPQSGRLT